MNRHNVRPVRCTEMCLRHVGCFFRSRTQNRHMASSDNENVKNTLIEYSTTKCVTFPPVYTSASREAPPISSTPYDIVSRSESWLKRCGMYESTAMFAITRGPSMNPACPATTSSSASDSSETKTNT